MVTRMFRVHETVSSNLTILTTLGTIDQLEGVASLRKRNVQVRILLVPPIYGSVDENEIGRSFSLRTKSPWGFESPHCYHFMTTQQKRIKHEQDYIEFLERRAKSANYKKNVSPEEYAATEAKLKKARLVMRVLSK